MKKLACLLVALATTVSAAHAQTLSPDAIRRVVRAHVGEVRTCYEHELARNPASAPRVAIRFTIGPSGRVQSVSTGQTALDRCLTKQVKRWRFPPPIGGGTVTVSYPFNFQHVP